MLNEYFESNSSFLDPRFLTLVEQNNINVLIELTHKLHLEEIDWSYSIQKKKVDLFILNAILCQHLSKSIVTSFPVHEIYNYFYLKIEEKKSLLDLQNLELEMIQKYLSKTLLLNDKTKNYTINRIIETIYLKIESDLKVKDIAKELNLSSDYISKLFYKKTGKHLLDFIHEKKLERAKHLLTTTDYSINEISDKLNFYDANHFIKLFKKYYGETPKKYKNKQ